MAKFSKNKSKKRSYSTAEKKSYKRGFFAGLFSVKRTSNKNIKKVSSIKQSSSLLDKIKMYCQKNLGVLYHNGKYYDTNFIDKPVVITKSEFKDLHKSYNYDGKRSDMEVADAYVKHMRYKYGAFNKKGEFLHMLGEDK